MHRRVRVGAPHRLLIGGDDVVVLVAVPVVAHGALLGQLLGVLKRYQALAVLGVRREHA